MRPTISLPPPLLRELVRASQMAQQSAFDEGLRELGLTGIPVPMWGIATVIAGPEFYEPDEGGTLAAIVPAFERIGERSELVDLVACSFVSREMRTRKGI